MRTVAALLAPVVMTAGCSPRTLTVVDPCPADGAATFTSCPPREAGVTTTLSRGLVGHWHFDDGVGSTLAHDSSESGNPGTLVTLDPSTAWVMGHIGTYALDTGGAGYASVARSASIDSIVHQVSMAAWMYLDGTIFDYATAASRQIGNSLGQYYHLAIKMGGLPSAFITTTRAPGTSVSVIKQVQLLGLGPDVVPLQRWTHIAETYDGAVARLFVNGVMVAAEPLDGDFGIDANPFILGGNGNGNVINERFPGRIDEIVLYNRALDDNEVTQLASGVTF